MAADQKRRRFPTVDPQIQTPFIIHSVFYSLILLGFLIAVFLLPDVLALEDYTRSAEARGLIADRLSDLHSWTWFALLTLLCIMAVHSFRALLRIVGPLHRLRDAFERIARLDLDFDINLRDGDMLEREAEQINSLVSEISERISTLQRSATAASEHLTTVEKAESPSAAQQELQDLRREIDTLNSVLGHFRVPQATQGNPQDPE